MPEAHAKEGEAAAVRPDQDPGGGLRAPRPRQAGAGAENRQEPGLSTVTCGQKEKARSGLRRWLQTRAPGSATRLVCLVIISTSATPQGQPRAPQLARLGRPCG